jgi:hypothetical protein
VPNRKGCVDEELLSVGDIVVILKNARSQCSDWPGDIQKQLVVWCDNGSMLAHYSTLRNFEHVGRRDFNLGCHRVFAINLAAQIPREFVFDNLPRPHKIVCDFANFRGADPFGRITDRYRSRERRGKGPSRLGRQAA